MRFAIDQIRRALFHPQRRARQFAADYLSSERSADPGLTREMLRVIDRFGVGAAFEHTWFLNQVAHDDETLAWCLADRDIPPDQRELWDDVAVQLSASLARSGIAFLRRHIDDLDFLTADDRALVMRRDDYANRAPEWLWDELRRICDDAEIIGDDMDEEYRQMVSLVEALGRHREALGERVVEALNNVGPEIDWFTSWLPKIAGKMRLEAAVPRLVQLFEEDAWDWDGGELEEGLKRIGTSLVVESVTPLYEAGSFFQRATIAEFFRDLHFDASIAGCRTCLAIDRGAIDSDKDSFENHQMRLLEAWVCNFDPESIVPARQAVLEAIELSPEVLALRSDLVGLAYATESSFPELETWSQDLENDAAHRRKWHEQRLLSSSSLPIDWLYENELDEYGDALTDEFEPDEHVEPVPREVTKVGRNDPCPCGSGKKFKKCCLHKTSDV